MQVRAAAPEVIGQVGDEAHALRLAQEPDLLAGVCGSVAKPIGCAEAMRRRRKPSTARMRSLRCGDGFAALAVAVAARNVAKASARPAASSSGRQQHLDQGEAALPWRSLHAERSRAGRLGC